MTSPDHAPPLVSGRRSDDPGADAPSHDAPSHDAPSHDATSHDATSHDATSRDARRPARRPGVLRALLLGLGILVGCLGASLALIVWVERGPRPDEEVALPSQEAARRSPRVLAGSGSNLLLTQRLLDRFCERGGANLRLEADSIGSSGGLRALRDDVIDGALVSRALRPGEAQEAHVIVYARTDVVLATTADTTWSRERVLAAYRAQDPRIIPLLRELGDSGVAAMRSVWPELAALHDEAVRARRFEVLYTDEAMSRALAEVNDAIGLFDRGQLTLRRSPAVALELASATKELSLVVRDERLDDFVAFLSTDEARALIRASGYEVP